VLLGVTESMWCAKWGSVCGETRQVAQAEWIMTGSEWIGARAPALI